MTKDSAIQFLRNEFGASTLRLPDVIDEATTLHKLQSRPSRTSGANFAPRAGIGCFGHDPLSSEYVSPLVCAEPVLRRQGQPFIELTDGLLVRPSQVSTKRWSA
jgi:hypothetical protein